MRLLSLDKNFWHSLCHLFLVEEPKLLTCAQSSRILDIELFFWVASHFIKNVFFFHRKMMFFNFTCENVIFLHINIKKDDVFRFQMWKRHLSSYRYEERWCFSISDVKTSSIQILIDFYAIARSKHQYLSEIYTLHRHQHYAWNVVWQIDYIDFCSSHISKTLRLFLRNEIMNHENDVSFMSFKQLNSKMR